MSAEHVSSSPLLAVRGLAFSRDETPIFGPLDFSVDANEALLVQGGNGAGKTTLLRVLAGLLRADAGEVEIDGLPARPESRARHIAYLGHLPGLKADLSALQNLEFLCGLHGRRKAQVPEAAMGIVGTVAQGTSRDYLGLMMAGVPPTDHHAPDHTDAGADNE